DMEFARRIYGASKKTQSLSGSSISGPFDLFSAEELRDRFHLRIGTPVPSDVFVFCKGEPTKPDITKVGGIPYWIDDRKWPKDRQGRSLGFLAQFNFLDSTDLVGPLPGDVLLLFVSVDEKSYPDKIHFEWLPALHPSVAVTEPERILYPNSVFHGVL